MSDLDERDNHQRGRAERHISARLTAFERHKDDLLDLLQKACKRTKSFDRSEAWRKVKFMAFVFLKGEAYLEQKQMLAPAGKRHKYCAGLQPLWIRPGEICMK